MIFHPACREIRERAANRSAAPEIHDITLKVAVTMMVERSLEN